MNQPNRITLIILILMSMTAWGGSWTSAKVITNLSAPEVLTLWRFLITVISFIPILVWMKTPMKLSKRSFLQALAGAVFIVIYNKFFFLGLRYGLAGAGGVLVTTMNPLLTFILTILLFKRAATKVELVGIILGFTGGLILLEIWEISINKLLISGNLFFLIASLAWASLSLTSERSKNYMSPVVFSFYVYGFAVVLDLFISLPYPMFQPLKFGLGFWLNILFLSVGCTTFATTVYFYASTRLGSRRASSFIFLVPGSAVLLSWVLLREIPRLSTIIGGIIGVSAVYLINIGAIGTKGILGGMGRKTVQESSLRK
jgi:drug/metabolite transporter (DMT)-like permease